MFSLPSCSLINGKPTNEQLIRDYLKKSMNDPGSYESVEFRNVFNKDQLKDFQKVYERRYDIIKTSLNLIGDQIDVNLKTQMDDLQIQSSNQLIFAKSKLLSQVQNQDRLANLMKTAYQEIDSKNVTNQNIEEAKSQFEGTENRMSIEKIKLNEILQRYGLNLNDLEINSQMVYHKYRVKNGLGALMLQNTIFYIDTISHVVTKSKDI